MDKTELAELLSDQPRFRVDQVWTGLYEQFKHIDEIQTLPTAMRSELAARLPLALSESTVVATKDKSTIKFLWELHDGARIETVLMEYPKRATVCISSQAGCAMGCGFCATGQAGFDRQLTVGEMVEQVIAAARTTERRVSNVVFMGMGEPFANYDNTLAAARRLTHEVGIAARHITISTVGVIPGILKIANEPEQFSLAISLHAANDELRDELVPLNKRYPLEDLAAACENYRQVKGRRLSFEWAMIDGVNDQDADAAELAAYAYRLHAHVNLIPLNPTPGWPTVGTPIAKVHAFASQLEDRGVNVTVRQNRGTDIAAACGQLKADAEIASNTSAVPNPTRR